MKKSSINAGSTQPWYRQFWPWFLIALPGTVVVAAFYTLYIANRHADDLVVDEYYKEGLAINRELSRQHRAETLGISASLRREQNRLLAKIEGPVYESQLRLVLSHPIEAERDLTLPLAREGEKLYAVTLPTQLEGRWHWIIDAGDGSEWRLDGDQRF